MRKLEARLEKLADEKWNEDAATEDEEAAAGLSLYTPTGDTSPQPSPSVEEGHPWKLPLLSMCLAFFLPNPQPLCSLTCPSETELIQPSNTHPSFSFACSLFHRLPNGSDRLGG